VPKTKSQYVTDPGDGLPARVIRSWARRKHHYLQGYLDILSKAMSRQRSQAFVDLFSGPGRCQEEETGAFVDGSPLIALRYPFTDHIYVELDSAAAEALTIRTAPYAGQRRITVIEGDCNLVIDRVVERLPRNGVMLAFVDPTTWQISFDTVCKLSEKRPVDLIVTFMAGMMKRVENGSKELDAFFGTTAYRTEGRYLSAQGKPTLSGLLACYREQLAAHLGYRDELTAREIVVRTPTNTPLYLMAFFSKHPLGFKFWDAITTRDEHGQAVLRF
jgi:three-Cys-motif partner protein